MTDNFSSKIAIKPLRPLLIVWIQCVNGVFIDLLIKPDGEVYDSVSTNKKLSR